MLRLATVALGLLLSATLATDFAGATFPGMKGPIGFTSTRSELGNFQLYEMSSSGLNPHRITNTTASDTQLAYSPSGLHVAFVSSRDGNDEIYTMSSRGDSGTRLTNSPASDTSPSYSPAGNRVLFTSDRDGDSEIYSVDTDGSGLQQLTDNPGGDETAVFSPDGTKIAFQSNRSGNPEIYLMNSNGTDQVPITSDPADDLEPTFSPDGTKLLFTSEREGDTEVYVMNVDGSDPQNLTDNSSLDGSAVFAPDGSEIAFTSDRTGKFEIYLMNANGSNQRAATDSETGVSFDPDWQPLPAPSPPGNGAPGGQEPGPDDTNRRCAKLVATSTTAAATRWVKLGTARFRLRVNRSGYALRSDVARGPVEATVQQRGRAKIRSVELSYHPLGAAAIAVKKRPWKIGFDPAKAVVGTYPLRATVRLAGIKRALRLKQPFSILNCAPVLFSAKLSTTRLRANPDLTLTAEARDTNSVLRSSEFELPMRFSAKLFRRLRGVRVATLSVQPIVGKRRKLILKVATVSGSKVVFHDINGTPRAELSASGRRGVLKTLEPSPLRKVTIRLTGRPGTRKTRALLIANPSSCKRLTFRAKLAGADRTAVSLTRAVRVCRR